MRYRARLVEKLWGGSGGFAASAAPFTQAYPDAVLNDGKTALTPAAFVAAKAAANIRTDEEYVRHILEKHNGEVRHWGARERMPVPEAFVPHLADVKFWHYQFAKQSEVRDWLYRYYHQTNYTRGLSGGGRSTGSCSGSAARPRF